MKRFCQNLGAAVLLLIPIGALLLMFEIISFSHRHIGYLIASYLTVVLILLTREIVLDVLTGIGRRDRGKER